MPIDLEIGSKSITIYSNLNKQLEKEIAREKVMQYWSEKLQISLDILRLSFITFYYTYNNLPSHDKIWLIK